MLSHGPFLILIKQGYFHGDATPHIQHLYDHKRREMMKEAYLEKVDHLQSIDQWIKLDPMPCSLSPSAK